MTFARLAQAPTAILEAGAAEGGALQPRILEVLLVPVLICAAMAFTACIAVNMAHVNIEPLLSYYECAEVTFLCVLTYIFIEVTRLAVVKADKPLIRVWVQVRSRLALLVLPAFVLPTFLIGYTAAKTAIPFLVGYTWDAFWANLDRALFGQDVWRIAARWLGTSNGNFWSWYYSVGWGTTFLLTANAIALYGRRRLVGIYFSAMMGSWLIGGCFLAYLFSAAGPVFAPAFEPTLASRFAPLHQFLAAALPHSPITFSQHYLVIAVNQHVAVKGGGISAMPSMHLATASIYVLAARRKPLFIPACLFWMSIFVASGYFGFHYWVDGFVAFAVAGICWFASAAVFSTGIQREEPATRLKYGQI